MLSRRKFLQAGAAGALLVTTSANVPLFLSKAFASGQFGAAVAGGARALVVVELSGGNDGLNTVVPYGDPLYYQLRPNIAIPADKVLPLQKGLGLHPALAPLHDMYKQGNLAVVQGVCYPNPNYSHFEAADIWQSAQPTQPFANRSGWLGRYLENRPGGNKEAASLMGDSPMALYSQTTIVPSINGLDDFRFQSDDYYNTDGQDRLKIARQIYQRVEQNPVADFMRASANDALATADIFARQNGNFQPAKGYPESSLAQQLAAVVQLLVADIDFRIFYVRLDGFDTHTDQIDQQGNLLQDLAASVAAFYADLKERGMADSVLTFTFSEFGRRPAENGGGTDHGSAQPMFMMGGGLRGGMYGQQPALNDLDDENLRFNIDFRRVYATLLQKWLNVDPQAILGESWAELPLFG